MIGCILCFGISILFFHWHLQAFRAGQHILHIALFYPSNIGFLFGILYGCKLLSHYKLQVIINLSIGTLAVIGLHAPLISLANHIIKQFFNIEGELIYTWYEALPITIFIVTVIYSLPDCLRYPRNDLSYGRFA